MRHRMKGRKLGRSSDHRRAMFRNMAASLIRTMRIDEDEKGHPKVEGRIVTTVPKAKELRPKVEKLITMAVKARRHEQAAEEFATNEPRDSEGWRQWRNGDGWQNWVKTKAPAVAARRRAFAILRDKEAVDVLFDELAEKFENRPGGYTRIVRLPTLRLGDGGQQALIEFTGERDRPRLKRSAAPIVKHEDESPASAPATEPVAETQSQEGEEAAAAENKTDEKAD